MKKLSFINFAVILIVLLAAVSLSAQDKPESKKKEGDAHKMHKMESKDAMPIDMKMVDKNKDGKVFQCSMCADQVSDVAGKCAKCEMKLSEVSVDAAAKSLKKMHHKMMDHDKKDHSKMMDDSKKMDEMKHEGHAHMNADMDVKAIDKNMDGKVFQCSMCADQVSDKAGKCPKCEMKMSEVSLDTAKASMKKQHSKMK